VATTITMKPPAQSQPQAAQPASAPHHWTRRHLLGLDGLSAAELRALLHRTRHYAGIANDPATRTGELEGRLVGTMFFEDSTRTRSSFTLAARRHSAEVIDLSGSNTSVSKGETIVDTARTLVAMGVSALVVRTRQSGGAAMVAAAVGEGPGGGCCSVLNAGDGRHEHPTQGLLDLYTIAESVGGGERLDGFDYSGLTVAIVGDVASSRVARSAIAGLRTLGARTVAVGSPALAPGGLSVLGCEVEREFDRVLPEADVVMMLRIQFERHGEGGNTGAAEGKKSAAITSIREYRARYGMTVERAARLKAGAIVMHPGPMNRGLEIDAEVADGPRSAVLRQVSRGVAARMAALAMCVSL
jgi:aspartate carbamoyltransferase catalytic subunit